MVPKLRRKNLVDKGGLDIDFGLTVEADEFFMERQKFDSGFIGIIRVNNNDLSDVWRSAFGANKFDFWFDSLISHDERSLLESVVAIKGGSDYDKD